MLKFRFVKKTSICLIVITQIVLIAYFLTENKSNNINKNKFQSSEKVSFIRTVNISTKPKHTYHTSSDHVKLKLLNTRDSYIDFNTSLCFINGTDTRAMHKARGSNWNCKCLPSWHGKDCSQPEVIWRALLAYRKPILIKGPRKYQRRIICLFTLNKFSEAIAEITINELNDVVDLFVLYDNRELFEKKLRNGLLKNFHNKILYIRNSFFKEALFHLRERITNLNEDDLILLNESNLILNKFPLLFLKFYDNWPEPLSFRLRWSVYGFFWLHPEKTKVKGFTSTVKHFNSNINHTLNHSFVIGDLNHYGGWYCELCNDPSDIVKILMDDEKYMPILENHKAVDSNYIEELIENGVYVDGKVQLKRGHRFNENYFAPNYVGDNSWKFDYLLINMYSKLDYYQ